MKFKSYKIKATKKRNAKEIHIIKSYKRLSLTMPFTTLDLFPNKQNWRIDNWQIATDTLLAIIKAQSHNFIMGVKIVYK